MSTPARAIPQAVSRRKLNWLRCASLASAGDVAPQNIMWRSIHGDLQHNLCYTSSCVRCFQSFYYQHNTHMICSTCHTPIPDDARFAPTAVPHSRYRRKACSSTQQPAQPTSSLAKPNHRHRRDLREPICWQCHGPMEQGFIPDFDDRTGGEPQYWVRGWPARNVQTGQIQSTKPGSCATNGLPLP